MNHKILRIVVIVLALVGLFTVIYFWLENPVMMFLGTIPVLIASILQWNISKAKKAGMNKRT